MNCEPIDAENLRNVLDEIFSERFRQHGKWGMQYHSLPEWITILGEEYGESCKDACDIHFGRECPIENLRKELIQTAAVAVQMIEMIDKNKIIGADFPNDKQAPWYICLKSAMCKLLSKTRRLFMRQMRPAQEGAAK
jgi:hypothetical protein